MENKNYAAINNLEELNAAIAANHRQLKRKEKNVVHRFSQFRESYTPQTLLKTGVRSAAISLIGPAFLLRTVRRAKRLLK